MKTIKAILGASFLAVVLGAGCRASVEDIAEYTAVHKYNWGYAENKGIENNAECKQKYPGFEMQAVLLKGLNEEGKVDEGTMCCITEEELFGIDTHTKYCSFL
ncbi:MAG: hypothetical protein KJ955_02650 [Nanoarchaeota archaeon]|nr:hypothetical protein [Nanoarchaeota archaeon]